MNLISGRPILITGSHRSGTTWLGHIINQSDQIYRIHEPFNIGIESYPHSPLKFWFEHLDPTKENPEIKGYIESFNWNYRKGLNEKTGKNLEKLLYLIKSQLYKRYLYKDPIALASAEWFFTQFNTQVIVSMRHPAAFVTSLVQKRWDFDFSNFTKQPLLIRDHLYQYETEIQKYTAFKKPLFENAILLWNCLYQIILTYRCKYSKQWYFIKNEDLSMNPIKEYEKIFNYLGLKFTTEVRQEIIKTTKVDRSDSINRKSLDNIQKWKKILTPSEISIIREKTYPLWRNFYSEEDW
ncbi:sulfotransferase domain-containing protein [Salinimicrobium catena]|uniref:sulfotransferase domain-containing protein n=1 Tax=Salinimicrobium catena TaxID=390640 RepID=UPI002FE44CC0